MKPRAKIKLEDLQRECRYRSGVCDPMPNIQIERCEYSSICHMIQDVIPKGYDLTDPPIIDERYAAFLKPWYENGAKWASRDSDDPFCHEITFYNGLQQIIGYMVHTQAANALPIQRRIDLAELFGKDA